MKSKLSRDLIAKGALIAISIFCLASVYRQWIANQRSYLLYGHDAHHCFSQLKQTMLASIMYSSDFEEAFPPHFTFESNQSRDQYIGAIMPYLQHKDDLICPSETIIRDEFQFEPGMEGDPAVMSYVHPQSLKGHISDYCKGNRLLDNSTIGEPETVPFLRDPIRGYKKMTVGYEKVEQIGFQSPHASGFNVGYLDGHGKSVKLDINKEL